MQYIRRKNARDQIIQAQTIRMARAPKDEYTAWRRDLDLMAGW